MNSAAINKTKSQIAKIFWITVGWTIISIYQFFSGYISLLDFNCNLEGHDPMVYLSGSIITGVIAGILGGSGIVFLWEKWLRKV